MVINEFSITNCWCIVVLRRFRLQEDHPIMSFVLNNTGRLALVNVATQVDTSFLTITECFVGRKLIYIASFVAYCCCCIHQLSQWLCDDLISIVFETFFTVQSFCSSIFGCAATFHAHLFVSALVMSLN